MDTSETSTNPTGEKSLRLLKLIVSILGLQNIEEIETAILPEFTNIIGSSSTCIFLQDPRLSTPSFFQYDQPPQVSREIQKLYAEVYKNLTSTTNAGPSLDLTIVGIERSDDLRSFKIQAKDRMLGIIGITLEEPEIKNLPVILEEFILILANTIDKLLELLDNKKQLSRLNIYLTVSSLLCQSINLHELLEIALYCCMEAVFAEAASVLLLNEDKKFFEFYQVEGAAKPLLMATGFPSDSGLAGSILQSGCSEIINDVYQDPRFYKSVDSDTGFYTRNMIALPLVAGEEQIGVLEVINKADGGDFLEEHLMLLVSIADEIAFAIRNAKIFEYVVNTYCKQRQGLMSCKGCQRPLGSWTPCVKYREKSI